MTKGLGIPGESDLEGQWDLITRLPQAWGKQTPDLEGTNKTLHTQDSEVSRPVGKTLQETEPNPPASVGRSPVEVCVGKGSPQGQRHWLQQPGKIPLAVNPLGGLPQAKILPNQQN